MRFKIFLITFSLFVALFFFFSPLSSFSEEKEIEGKIPMVGGVYRRALESNPKTLDPALSTDIYAVTVIQQVFDGLVQFDKNLNVVPAIAKSWKISADGLTYTFYMRQGVKFHNGREVTAQDFVYSFTRILDPETKSSSSNFFTGVVGAKEFMERKTKEVKGLVAQDKYTLRVMLSEPYVPFISILAMKGAKVVPREEIEKSGENFGKLPIGTGPFKFVSMKEGEEIVLEANPDYFEGRPYLDKIIFKIFHGSPYEDIFGSFVEGTLEETRVASQEFRDPSKLKNFYIVRKPILSLRFYGMQIKTKPFDNKKVRQAINFAINKEEIDREAFQGMDHITDRIIPLGMPGSSPAKMSYSYNPKRAKELLLEAGYPGGEGIPPLEFWSAQKAEMTRKELEIVKSNLANIGINLQIHTETNWKRFEEMMISYKTPMFRYAWYADIPDPDNFLGILFHSKSQYNYMAYQNPKVDHLLDRAKTERDYIKRMEMYRKIEEVVLEDAPIVPSINNLFQMAYQPYVRGLEVTALGGPYIPMKKVWFVK